MVSPGLMQRHEGRRIGLAAGMRLHIGVVGTEQALDAIDGQLLDDVDILAATVVALARIAFGVLVGEHRTLRLEHARTGVVLRGDELDVLFLPHALAVDGARQFGIKTLDRHRLGIHGVAGLREGAPMVPETAQRRSRAWSGSKQRFHHRIPAAAILARL